MKKHASDEQKRLSVEHTRGCLRRWEHIKNKFVRRIDEIKREIEYKIKTADTDDDQLISN